MQKFNLKAKTPPITVYLSKHLTISIFQGECPIPQARILNHRKLLIPANLILWDLHFMQETNLFNFLVKVIQIKPIK